MQEFIRTFVRTTTCLCAVSFWFTADTTLGGGAAWAATELPGLFGGTASAGSANVTAGSLRVPLLHLAHVGCPCEGTLGKTHSVQTGPISVPGVFSVTLSEATATADRTKVTAQNAETSSLSQLSLLGGLITADLLQAAAGVSATTTSLQASYSGSSFSNLVIAGTPVDPNVAPNTLIPLPGIGSVTVFGVTQHGYRGERLGITVDMLAIQVTQENSFNLPVGAVIRLGEASAEFSRDQPASILKGNADIAGANEAGLQVVPELRLLGRTGIGGCHGTDGATHTKQFAGLNTPLVSLGAGSVSAFAGPTGTYTSMAQTTANIADISLLGGLISANAITAEATETAIGTAVTGSTAGTQFTGLAVVGVNVPLNPPANTKITIPLLGTLVLNEQTTLGHGRRGVTAVTALHLYTTEANLFGLPVGAEITIGHAEAAAVVPYK
jgi:hypothetical protein